MYKIIALVGKAGSGKDTIMHKVLEKNPNLHEIVSCTTRPPREGETEGVNYFFLTPEEFNNKSLCNEMLESTCFNNWLYGTSYESLDLNNINIGVFNPKGIESLIMRPDIEVKVFYVNASSKDRLLRQLNREKNPNVNEIIRRYLADQKDFFNLNFDYNILYNETYEDVEVGAKLILNSLANWMFKDKNC